MIRKSFLTSAAVALALGVNPALAQSSGNLADIKQGGSDVANVTQEGKDNTTYLDQVGGDGATDTATVEQNGANNFVDSYQQSWVGGYGNSLKIEQLGSENDARTFQMTGKNTINLSQDGIGNFADIEQRSSATNADTQAEQIGDDNRLYVSQGIPQSNDVSGKDNRVTVLQNGNSNYGNITQTNDYGDTSEMKVSLTQNGNDNSATVTQSALQP